MTGLKKLTVDKNPFEKPEDLPELLLKGVLESFAFSGDQFQVFSLDPEQFNNLKRLEISGADILRFILSDVKKEDIPKLAGLDLAGRPLETLHFGDRILPGQASNPGPLKRLVINSNYRLIELAALADKLKPA